MKENLTEKENKPQNYWQKNLTILEIPTKKISRKIKNNFSFLCDKNNLQKKNNAIMKNISERNKKT